MPQREVYNRILAKLRDLEARWGQFGRVEVTCPPSTTPFYFKKESSLEISRGGRLGEDRQPAESVHSSGREGAR